MKKFSKYIFASLLVLSLGACEEYLDINTNPGTPIDAPIEALFPAAVASSAGQIGGWYQILGGLWSQYWTQSNAANQYKRYDGFNIVASDYDNLFNEIYSGALNDFHRVLTKAEEEESWNFYLMATVMQAYVFQMMADLYDQVPYSEAFEGNEGVFNPHYESGELIYADLLTRIDAALAKDLTDQEIKGSADFLFGGDMTNWKQFANTLKLKLFLRQCYANPTEAQAGVTALLGNADGFLGMDAAMTQFVDQASRSNPLYESDQRQLNTNSNLKASYTFMSWLEASADPRIDALFHPPAAGGVHASLYQGDYEVPSTVIDPTTISRALIQATDPVYFVSLAESHFLQAEAELRYGTAGNVKAQYDAGILAGFARLGFDGSAFIAPGGAYEFPAAGDMETKLKAIMTHKWACLAGAQNLEMFFETNRTGYPAQSAVTADDINYVPGELTYPVNAVLPVGSRPKRLLFPDIEKTRNENIPAEVPITTKVWWDQK